LSDLRPPSPFFRLHLDRLRESRHLGPALDLACGRGHHALALAAAGGRAIGVDRNAAALLELRQRALAAHLPVDTLRADLETRWGIPLGSGSCGAILVFRFLFRPLAGPIRATLAPGGLLLYETFTTEQQRLGTGPRNPAFLLRPGELRELFAGLEIVDYWEGVTGGERPEAMARLVARRA
jgi:SAM-dependent methyltransferase